MQLNSIKYKQCIGKVVSWIVHISFDAHLPIGIINSKNCTKNLLFSWYFYRKPAENHQPCSATMLRWIKHTGFVVENSDLIQKNTTEKRRGKLYKITGPSDKNISWFCHPVLRTCANCNTLCQSATRWHALPAVNKQPKHNTLTRISWGKTIRMWATN